MSKGCSAPVGVFFALLGLALHRWRFFLKKEGRLSTALRGGNGTAHDDGAVKSKQ
jgi:hypothetical protein